MEMSPKTQIIKLRDDLLKQIEALKNQVIGLEAAIGIIQDAEDKAARGSR